MNEIEIMATIFGLSLVVIGGIIYLYDKRKHPEHWK